MTPSDGLRAVIRKLGTAHAFLLQCIKAFTTLWISARRRVAAILSQGNT
jgi:hypothetical protein